MTPTTTATTAATPARQWLTVREYAEAVQVSEITVRRHCYSGIVPSKKFGRALRVHASALAGPDHE